MDRNVLTEICLHQLTLSGVHEGEKVIVLSQGGERLDYADAFLAAGQRLGARMYHMRLPAPLPGNGAWAVGETGLAANPEAVEALKQADMVVDLIFLLFSPEQMAIQAAGARVLTAVEPAPLLARLLPTKELRERVEIGEALLAKAKT
ncbi:leucyl aminopeptidase, partial [Mesorhizobium sp. M7D.F.Ca.US.004.01.2.1]